MHSPPTHAYSSNAYHLGMCFRHLDIGEGMFNVHIGESDESRTNTPVCGNPTDTQYGSAPGKSPGTLTMMYLIYFDCLLRISKDHQVIEHPDGQRTIVKTTVILLMMNPLRYRIIRSGPSG